MLVKLFFLFGCLYAGGNAMKCGYVTGKFNGKCICEVYENGTHIFSCPPTLPQSHYLEELGELEEALKVKYPGNRRSLPTECEYEGTEFFFNK